MIENIQHQLDDARDLARTFCHLAILMESGEADAIRQAIVMARTQAARMGKRAAQTDQEIWRMERAMCPDPAQPYTEEEYRRLEEERDQQEQEERFLVTVYSAEAA